MSHRIEFSPEALGDLIDLYDYIAQRDGAERAIGYIDRRRGPSGTGRVEGESQCQQAQSDELRPDAGEGKAAESLSEAAVGTGRSG